MIWLVLTLNRVFGKITVINSYAVLKFLSFTMGLRV